MSTVWLVIFMRDLISHFHELGAIHENYNHNMVSKYISFQQYFKLSSCSNLSVSVFDRSQLRNQEMYKPDPDWQVSC